MSGEFEALSIGNILKQNYGWSGLERILLIPAGKRTFPDINSLLSRDSAHFVELGEICLP